MFATRSLKKELLDEDNLSFPEIRRNLEELEAINKLLGGHRITLQGISYLLPSAREEKPLLIAEIGSGGGDNLRRIGNYLTRRGVQHKLIGIDNNCHCIAYAESRTKDFTEYIHSDFRNVVFAEKPDIIFTSLFCHHFQDAELISMFKWLYQNTRVGFFINDLHRHPVAYYSIKFLTRFFSKSNLVKNDAPLSVARSFVRADWDNLFSKACINRYHLTWGWAFRWLVTYRHADK